MMLNVSGIDPDVSPGPRSRTTTDHDGRVVRRRVGEADGSDAPLASILQAREIGDEALVCAQQLVPRDDAAGVGRGPSEDRHKGAAHALGDRRVGVVRSCDGVMKRGDVVHGPLLVNRGRLSSAVELLAPDQHLPAVLRLEDAVGSEHAVPDALGPRALTVELTGREGDPYVVGVLEHDAERVPARANVAELAPAGAAGGHWRLAHDPAGDVERVDVLLRDDVPGEHAGEAPRPQPALGILGPGVLRLRLERIIRVVRGLAKREWSERAIVDES